MADITLNIKGDASGATAALKEVGNATEDLSKQQEEQSKASKEAWKVLAAGAAAASAAVVAFGVSSVKAFADAEKVTAQLKRAAGEYADALDEQAQAMSKVYAVDDDIIKQSQILLTQWGGVAAATNDVEKAALNLSVAMGVDLDTATRALIKNVETGGAGLAKFGVEFKATGDRGKDLAAVVESINKRLGGAAKSDADTLSGNLRAASLAFEDIQKSLGGTISVFIKQTGVVGSLTDAMRQLNSLFTPSADVQQKSKAFLESQAAAYRNALSGQFKMFGKGGAELSFEAMQDELAKLESQLNPQSFNVAGDSGPTVGGKTTKGAELTKQAEADAARHNAEMEKLRASNIDDFRAYQRGIDELDEHARERDEKSAKESFDTLWKTVETEAAVKAKLLEDEHAFLSEQAKMEDSAQREKEAKYNEAMDKEVNALIRHNKEMSDRMEQFGDQLGAAFVNALANQLNQLADGGEFDVESFMLDIFAAAFAITATAIGTAYGQPALGAAVGNLGSAGIMLGRAELKKSKAKKHHSGGWIGDEDMPRFHDGSWIGDDERRAILQTGERVLSRGEVSKMGGPGAVDGMARGGRHVVVNISALDAKSVAVAFETSAGRGFAQALRSGRGDIARILGTGETPR